MLFLALLLLPLALVAQSEAELIELNAETLEFNAWQELYRQLLSPGSELGLDNRLWLTDQSYSLHRLMFRHQGRELALNLYNDWTDGDTDANVSIRLAQDKLLRDVALGHYRLQFGTGISMGSGSRSLKGPVLQIERPPSPRRYSPFGAAIKTQWKQVAGLLFASVAAREARLNAASEIISLPRTKTGLDGSTRENLWGAALSYEAKLFRLGVIAYRQSYDRDFEGGLERVSTAGSVYGALRFKAHTLDLESGLTNDSPHHYLAWNYRHQGFEQTLSFAIDPDQDQVAYSTPREVLSRDPDTMEMAWDARFPLFKDARLGLRFAADHLRGGSVSTNDLRTRLLASFEYGQQAENFSFRVSHFDREVLSHIDEDYNLSRPKHWRFELAYKDQVLPYLGLMLNCRYHIEDKSSWKDNGLYYHSALQFQSGKLSARLGYQGWQSSKTGLWYEDDTLSAWSVAGKDDQNLYLSADLNLKRLKLGLNIRQSLTDQDERRIIMRLETWI
ncbi:MAG: hypothetical protein KBA79_04545 [Candidatus Cloacimonetes bacterium]|mgnify:CR=1 FL=1|nr:hypothetical protein [Candidatus Cloacimonadota bacterium]HNZ06799.1 hypothetical protein [Candidatus Cloacimonadota bacterium]HOH78567.1 hypothetical protein [Candidatus Cloacimonadota bacterium]